MTTIQDAIAELRDLTACRCDAAYTGRGLHDPACQCDSKDAVDAVADRIDALEKALELAAGRLTWCAGIIPHDDARDMAGGFADEARAALGEGE